MKYVYVCLLLLTSSPVFSDVIEYFKPMVNDNRLDWCSSWGKDCGEIVALKWCIKHNYSKPIYWEADNGIGRETPTTMLDSGEICKKSSCSGFRVIVCYREFKH